MYQPSQKIPSELFMSYRRGWVDGSRGVAVNPVYAEHETRSDISEEYIHGYNDAVAAKGLAFEKAAKRFGFDRRAAILREAS